VGLAEASLSRRRDANAHTDTLLHAILTLDVRVSILAAILAIPFFIQAYNGVKDILNNVEVVLELRSAELHIGVCLDRRYAWYRETIVDLVTVY